MPEFNEAIIGTKVDNTHPDNPDPLWGEGNAYCPKHGELIRVDSDGGCYCPTCGKSWTSDIEQIGKNFRCLRNMQAEPEHAERQQRHAKYVAEGTSHLRYDRETLEPNRTIAYHLDDYGYPVIHLGVEPHTREIFDIAKEEFVKHNVVERCVRFMTCKEYDARKLSVPFIPLGDGWLIVGDIFGPGK